MGFLKMCSTTTVNQEPLICGFDVDQLNLKCSRQAVCPAAVCTQYLAACLLILIAAVVAVGATEMPQPAASQQGCIRLPQQKQQPHAEQCHRFTLDGLWDDELK